MISLTIWRTHFLRIGLFSYSVTVTLSLEPLAEVSVKEARSSFDTLQSFCLQNESDEKAFQALFLLKKVIEQCEQQNCALKQTSITKFFRKIN